MILTECPICGTCADNYEGWIYVEVTEAQHKNWSIKGRAFALFTDFVCGPECVAEAVRRAMMKYERKEAWTSSDAASDGP